ncbi:MAG: MerR family transcriptional regulator [Clostridia bacterium]|nr:MerR family transcriptional regulator [Clostridia bacterium]
MADNYINAPLGKDTASKRDNINELKKSDELYTVGQISNMCNIPIKTLRYYDEIGLLPPEYIDEQNNYRYYSKKQILQLSIIKHFKTSGFSLEDIRALIKREDLAMLEKKLEDKLQQTVRKIQELEYQRKKIETDIQYLKMGKEFSEYWDNGIELRDKFGIEIKEIPKVRVLYTRYRCPSNPGSYIKRYSELGALLEKYKLHRAGPLMAIFYDHYTVFDYDNADVEVCVPVAGDLSQCPNIREYGGFLGVTMLHKGEYSKMTESYGAAMNWIDRNGYEFMVPATEKYIIDPTSTGLEENYVTEIILPVKKVK